MWLNPKCSEGREGLLEKLCLDLVRSAVSILANDTLRRVDFNKIGTDMVIGVVEPIALQHKRTHVPPFHPTPVP